MAEWGAVLKSERVERDRQDGLQGLETIFCLVICNTEEPIQVMRGDVLLSGRCNFKFNNTL